MRTSFTRISMIRPEPSGATHSNRSKAHQSFSFHPSAKPIPKDHSANDSGLARA